MNDPNREAAWRALADPLTSPEALAGIVSAYPEFGAQAAQHPSAYPELVAWIQEFAGAAAAARATTEIQPADVAEPTAAEEQMLPAAEPVANSPATEAPATRETTEHLPRRRLAVIALAAVAALVVGAAGVTGAMAITKLTASHTAAPDSSATTGPAKSSPSPASYSAKDGTAAEADAAGGVLPYTDTASGAADLVQSGAEAGTGPIILILDASGSMVRETSPGRTRMQDAKDAMTKAIGMLPKDARVGLLVFGTGTGNDASEQARGCTDVKTAHGLSTLDAKALTSAVAAVQPSGFTPLGPSLRTAAGMLPADGPGTIVLISDGVDTCSPPPACEVASDLRSANPALTIHAVGFAIDDDEQAQQQLQCIGQVGGGGYISAANVQQLSARIARATRTDAASVLSETGFHGIRLGMTLDEVRMRVPGFTVAEEKSVDGIEYVYVDCDWGRIEFRSGIATVIAPKDAVSTLDGVSIGDTTADVQTVYGEQIDAGHNELGEFAVYRVAADSPYAYRVYGKKTVERIVLCRCVPTALAGGYASWEVTYDGVGPIVLGMTVDELRSVLPDAGALGPEGKSAVTWRPMADQEWLSVEIADGKIVKVTVRPMDRQSYSSDLARGPALPHMRGVRIGDTMSTVKNVIPGGTTYDVRAAGIHTYITSTRTGHVISFETAWTDGDAELLGGVTLADANAADVNFPAPEVVAVDEGAWPDDLRGTWCQKEDPGECFSVKDTLSRFPDASVADGPSAHDYQPEARDYVICLEEDLGAGECTTAASMFLTYYPVGADGDCPGAVEAGWPACENNFPHDTSKPRLVIQPNHQQGDKYWDMPPMYKQ